MQTKNICLAGNPNCGKTTLFNYLTGTYQKVGNRSGVTTEAKTGEYKKDSSIKITDLPGVYSLAAVSKDEKAVTDYLLNSPPDVIINVLDGTNLERNLFLTCELSRLKIPTVIAVNFSDELEKNAIALDTNALSNLFGGVPVIKISALKRKGIGELIANTERAVIPTISEELKSTEDIYAFIESAIGKIIKRKQTRAERFTLKADGILTHKIWGVPIFAAIMTLIYFTSIKAGLFFGGYIENFFDAFGEKTGETLYNIGAAEWLISLVKKAVFGGLGTVLAFLPQILILFFFMTILEEAGYMARVSFLFDGIFRKAGLGGKSLIPLVVSCGCSVTGIMSARTIENESERAATVILSPFMPCGAKTAVFGWFASAFFGGNPFIAVSLYFLSIFCVAIFGNILKSFKPFKSGGGLFLLEMPILRVPHIKNVLAVLREKTLDFTVKAGTTIFAVSVVLWVLNNFGIKGYTGGVVENSFIYYIGSGLKYIFYPLGFGFWQAAVAIVAGLLAKEAVIETFAALCADKAAVVALFESGYTAYAFCAFILLMPPCAAALAAARRELKSKKTFAFMLVFQSAAAYIVALCVNLLGKLFTAPLRLRITILFVIMIIATFAVCLKFSIGGCGVCKKCKEVEKCPKRKRNTT